MQPPPLPGPIGRRGIAPRNAMRTCPPPTARLPTALPDHTGAASDGEIVNVIVTDRSPVATKGGVIRRRGRKARGPWPFVTAIVLGGVAALPIVLVGLRVIRFVQSAE